MKKNKIWTENKQTTYLIFALSLLVLILSTLLLIVNIKISFHNYYDKNIPEFVCNKRNATFSAYDTENKEIVCISSYNIERIPLNIGALR